MNNRTRTSTLAHIILPDAKRQPDRYLVIVTAAVIEDELSEIIQERLVENKKIAEKLFTGTGPVSSFSAKIDMGYLLGLYHDEFGRMLHSIRNIRNVFAH